MTDEQIVKLLGNHHNGIKAYEKGDIIFLETDKPRNIFVLLSGSVVIAKDTPAGKRKILTQIDRAGELFGEVYAFMGKESYDMYAETQEKTVILVIEKTILREKENSGEEFIQVLKNNLLEIFAAKAYHMNLYPERK